MANINSNLEQEESRLTQERKRLGLKLGELAELIGIARQTQTKYEKQERSPDSDYLSAAEKLGFDVYYILTGRRFTSSEVIQSLLEKYETKDIGFVVSKITKKRSDSKSEHKIADFSGVQDISNGYEESDRDSQNGSSDPIVDNGIGSDLNDPSIGSGGFVGMDSFELAAHGNNWMKHVNKLSEQERDAVLTLVFTHSVAEMIKLKQESKNRASLKDQLKGIKGGNDFF